MSVTRDGEDIARRVFRRAQNGIESEGSERDITEVIKNSNNNIFHGHFPQKIIN